MGPYCKVLIPMGHWHCGAALYEGYTSQEISHLQTHTRTLTHTHCNISSNTLKGQKPNICYRPKREGVCADGWFTDQKVSLVCVLIAALVLESSDLWLMCSVVPQFDSWRPETLYESVVTLCKNSVPCWISTKTCSFWTK